MKVSLYVPATLYFEIEAEDEQDALTRAEPLLDWLGDGFIARIRDFNTPYPVGGPRVRQFRCYMNRNSYPMVGDET